VRGSQMGQKVKIIDYLSNFRQLCLTILFQLKALALNETRRTRGESSHFK